MFLTHGNNVHDFDLDLLVELMRLVDNQLAVVEEQISRSPDPDGFGDFNRCEAIVGLGFVACQQYINATYPYLRRSQGRKERGEIIALGPMHSCGRSFAEIVDAGANYWKHHDEWRDPTSGGKGVKTRAVIDSITPALGDYPLGNLLYGLARPEPARFSSLIYQLTLWRDLNTA